MQTFVNVYIEISTSSTYSDLPQDEKKLPQPDYYKPIPPRNVESGIASSEFNNVEESSKELTSRLDNVIDKNRRLADAADYMINKISDRLNGISIRVDPDKTPDVYNAMTSLFGEEHDGVLTFAMYIKLLEYTHIYGQEKVRGTV